MAKLAGARHHLTIAEKNQLRACHRAQPEMTQELLRDWAHSKFGKWVGRSTIGKITSSPDETCVNQDAKRNQSGRFPDMERELYDFVLAAAGGSRGAAMGAQGNAGGAGEGDHTVGEQPATTVLNDAVLWAKANEILKNTLGEPHSVSVGWVQRFKKRHGLHKGQKRPLHHYPVDGNGAAASAFAATPAETAAAAAAVAAADTRMDPPVVADVLAVPSVNTAPNTGDGASVDRETPQLLPVDPSSAVDRTEQQTSDQLEEQQQPPAATTLSDSRSGKGPVRKQFLAADDILLLTQALVTKPWTYSEAMDGWRQVADVLRSHEGFGLEKSAGACQARANLLVEHARSGNEGALRKSGSTEEFQQKKQLLAEIVTELDRAGDGSRDANSRKRPASELAVSMTEPGSSRRRAMPETSSQGTSSVVSAVGSGDNDDVTRRLALLETKLELELAVQRRNAEQQVRELGKQYQQQLERHQRQFDQQLASIQQQQVTIIELLKIVVERSANQVQSRPE